MIRYLALLASLLVSPVWAAPPSVAVSLSELGHHPSDVPPHVGHDCVNQSGSLSTGAITYGLQYTACWDKAHDSGSGYLEGYIGMPQPSAANWYHSGFLGLKINGADLGAARLSDFWVAEQGQRGNLKMYWDSPQAGVTVSFVALAGDDRLFCGITLNPRQEIKTLSLRLQSYPSYFTYYNKRQGDRKLTTASATYGQEDGRQQALSPAEQWWLAFTDTIFDPARGEGDGGCAVLFLPEQVLGAKATVGSYACPVELEYKPQTRVIRLCLWDFNRRGNEESLTRLRAALGPTRELLGGLQFAPLALTEYDVTASLTAARTPLAPLVGSAELLARLEAQAAELLALQRQVREGLSPTPATAEKTLAQKLAAFEEALWAARFFVLLNG